MAKEILFNIGASDKTVIAMAPASLLFNDESTAEMPVHRFVGSRDELKAIINKIIDSFYDKEFPEPTPCLFTNTSQMKAQ
jgi:hypothetical protein